jgi:hypothetical protein
MIRRTRVTDAATAGLRLATIATAALLVGGGLAGCSMGDGGDRGSDPAVTAPEGANTPDTTPDAGAPVVDNGRAFNSTDDAVISSVESAMSNKNAKAEWRGSTLLIALDGSAAAPTAGILCTAPEAIVSAEENVVLVYSDGEFDCDARPGGRRAFP